mgnify:CR=1 FL=1
MRTSNQFIPQCRCGPVARPVAPTAPIESPCAIRSPTATSMRELGMKPAPGAPETVIYDVWLDEDDLIRRMEFTLNGATARLLASEWGEPVSITAPDRMCPPSSADFSSNS